MATMKAVRFHGNQDLRLDEVPVAKVGPDQVKIAPEWCGLCGSGRCPLNSCVMVYLHEYLEGPHYSPAAPHPITKENLPRTFGHEFAGRVVEVGTNVDDLKPGDKVSVYPLLYDGTCARCLAGHPNICENLGFYGISGWGGGLSEAVSVDRKKVYKLPPNMTTEDGALCEPLAVAWHAVKLADFKAGQSALIIGAGPIGLAVLLCLKAFGAKTILISEIAAMRKEQAERFGVDAVLDPTQVDVVKKSQELIDGIGPHVAFDCSGLQITYTTAVKAIRARGIVVNVALVEKPLTFDSFEFLTGEKKYVGSSCYTPEEYAEVIEAVASGKIKPQEMVTGRIPLERTHKDGFLELIHHKDKHIKILVSPTLAS